MSEADYNVAYAALLAKLDPQKTYDELSALGGPDAVLLCWEGFNARCHRRWVAEWLEQHLMIVVPEIGHMRGESIPFLMQKRPEKKKSKKEQKQLVLLPV